MVGLGQFADLRGEGLARKREWYFWGGVDTPMHTMYIVSEKEKMAFWYACFPDILWTVLVVSIPNLQLMSNVWRKLKVDCHTTTKAITLQIVRFHNINCIKKKTETAKANSF